MAYSQEVYRRAAEMLDRRREKANILAQNKFEEISENVPELEEIQRKLSQIGLKISKVFLYGEDKQAEIEKLKKQSLELQQQKKDVLVSKGYDENALEVQYNCPHCKDTGFIKNRLCSCHRELLKDIERGNLEKLVPLKDCTFESFVIDEKFYPGNAFQKTEKIFNSCRQYAIGFTPASKNVLFLGGVGVGKTHLSLAIANVVINRGYSVVFGTSQNIVSDLQSEEFNDGREQQYYKRAVLNCDLLVIDDLGTEVLNPSRVAILYNIINSRLLSKLPTIITTNFTLDELEEKYDQRIFSRITGEYKNLTIDGNDVRYYR